MGDGLDRIKKPHCYLVYALAPEELSVGEANQIFNRFLADRRLPLALFHDHFIARPGGVAVFFVENPNQRDTLLNNTFLEGWRVKTHALVYSDSPAAFDEQIAFTLKAYRGIDWEVLQRAGRPTYRSPSGDSPDEAES